MSRFDEAFAAPDDQPARMMAGLQVLAQERVGAQLFSLLLVLSQARLARRIWTSHPVEYPTGGTKPLPDDALTRTLLLDRRIHVMNSYAQIEAVFPDAALIRSLGCESCMNIPVTVAGQVVGLVNCLHVAGHYTADRVAAAQALMVPAAAVFLAFHQLD